MRVLIVDDERTVARVFERLLQRHGLETHCVGTAAAALRLLEPSRRWDGFLLDWSGNVVSAAGEQAGLDERIIDNEEMMSVYRSRARSPAADDVAPCSLPPLFESELAAPCCAREQDSAAKPPLSGLAIVGLALAMCIALWAVLQGESIFIGAVIAP